MWERITESIHNSYADDHYRRIILFNVVNLLFAFVSGVMTAVNILTGEIALMCVTGGFSALCIVNVLLVKGKTRLTSTALYLFCTEALVLLTYFVVSGNPQGFSVLWILLVPAIAMSVLGKKLGLRFCGLVFLMVLFFFWLPAGRNLLRYDYGNTFMLRFPFVYLCLFFASLYVDAIRQGAYDRVKEMEHQAIYLYRHDALTGTYTRYAFYEELQTLFAQPSEERVSAVLFDLDDFKMVNDVFGHNAGDEFLRQVAKIISSNICEHCIVCRWGGEEFLVLMRCKHDPYEQAERIRRVLENTPLEYKERQLNLTVSVGVAVADTLRREQLDDFINCADRAMYASKTQGKNRVTLRKFR